jgi:hypothetical protein
MPPEEQERWNDWFARQFDLCLWGQKIARLCATGVDEGPSGDDEPRSLFVQTIGATLADVRREARAELDDALVTLKGEMEGRLAAMEAKLAEMEERIASATGELPQVREWAPQTVCYKGGLLSYDGALWQAKRDCATRPGSCDDWVMVARAGKDGKDGRELCLRGVYDMHDAYARLDVVFFGGEPFVALRDNPGMYPGEGWQLLAPRGARGERGERGPRGAKGAQGEKGDTRDLTIVSWSVDRARFRATPLLSNATVGSSLELRALFEEYQAQTS